MFDSTAIPSTQAACDAGYTYEPMFPGTTKGIGATITVRGPHSEAARKHSQELVDRARERALVQRRGQAPELPTLEEIERDEIQTAVVYTAAWDRMAEDGQVIAFSPEAAARLYARHPWLRLDVLNKARDLGNFIRPCSTSSTSTREPSSGSI